MKSFFNLWKFRSLALLPFFLILTRSNAQGDFTCHTAALENGGTSSPALLGAEPACWPDYSPPCEEVIKFAPDPDSPEDTPIKYVKVVLHVFQNSSDPSVIHSPGNFTNSQEHLDVLRSWFHDPILGINTKLANVCDPLPKVPGFESPHIPDARVRFLFEGIENEDVFFYDDADLWDGGYYCCNLGNHYDDFVTVAVDNNPIVQSNPEILNAVHVFMPAVSVGPNTSSWCSCGSMPSYGAGGYTYFDCDIVGMTIYGNFYRYMYHLTGESTWVNYEDVADPNIIPNLGNVILAEWFHMVSVDHPHDKSHLNSPPGIFDHCDDTPVGDNINNYMGGNDQPPLLKCGLTQCQLGRAHRYLDLIKPNYIRFPANGFQFPAPWNDCQTTDPDLIIGDNQTITWDGEKILYSNVVVESGSTLIIDCDVFMSEGGSVIIEPNAELVLNGRITANCSSWQGIEVWGDNSQSQYPINGVRAQGRFVGKPGSVIENAETAIKLYGPTYNDAGGQISCSGTTFLNNSTAIEFAPYQNYWPFPSSQQGQPRSYFGSLSDCTFLVNDDYTVSTSFNAFIKMTAVNGVRIYGSSFTNAQSPSSGNVQGYGYGIIASESGFRVDALCTGNTYPCNSFDRSTFTGLGYGIQISNVTTSRPYILKQTDFTDCYYGLYNTGVSNATLLFNTFNLGQVPNPGASEDQIGIFLEMGLAGFTLQENEFIGTSGNVSNTAGTYCRHLDEFNNEIRRNTYIGLDIGNLAEGDNATSPLNQEERGLNYLCNYNDDLSTADFWVGDVFGTNRIRQSQGLQEEIDNVITYSAAGNRFAYTGFDFNNEVDTIDYYYYEQGAQEKPLTFSGITDIEAVENTCPVVYCEPPCKDSGEVAQEKDKYYQDQSKNETAKTEQEAAEASGNTTLADAKAQEASYYRQCMDQEAYMVVLHLMYDTTNFNIDTLATWVENLDVFSMDLIWALRQQSNGKYDEAVAALARANKRENLSDQDKADLRDMPILLTVLKGKQAHEVDSRYFKTLEELTINAESFTGNIAKNILRLHGHYFPPVYHFPERKKSEMENLSFALSQPAKELEVFPNPSNGQFTLHWNPINKSLESASLEIRDLTGRLVHNQQLTAFTQQAIDLSSQSAGIYYYHLHIGDDMPSVSGKLIIQ